MCNAMIIIIMINNYSVYARLLSPKLSREIRFAVLFFYWEVIEHVLIIDIKTTINRFFADPSTSK